MWNHRSSKCARSGGFTLLEVLVVVVIVAVLMGTVVAGFTGAGNQQDVQGVAERLALRIELARDKALQRNREWGVYLENDGYSFAEFDELNGTWVAQEYRPFANTDFTEQIEVSYEAEAFEGRSSADDELPTLVLYSSGETTPFKIFLQPVWESEPWRVSSDGLSRTMIDRGDV